MKKILLVEDVDMNIDLLTQLLEDEYELVVARDGLQAVEMCGEFKPDLILMDINLPIIDGYEAVKRIRPENPAVPIIGVSAHAMQGDADKAVSRGFSDYITKPIDEDLLFTKIHQFLG
jgi:CheY-like chemotaxis protein